MHIYVWRALTCVYIHTQTHMHTSFLYLVGKILYVNLGVETSFVVSRESYNANINHVLLRYALELKF